METKTVICRKCNFVHSVPKTAKIRNLVCGAVYFGLRCCGKLKKN